MRSEIVVAALFSLLVASTASAAPAGKGDCRAILSWSAPAYRCAAAPAPVPEPEPEPEKEPEPEPEPEKEPEPEPEPEKRVEVKEEAIELSEVVQFRSGSAELLPDSEKLLSEVADALKEHPEILKIRVEGHTDTRAGSRYNRKLSRARARSVRKYLIEQGVAGRRLVARGYGEKAPVETNETPEGRYKNRRVEFKILKRKR
jgi:outer membrane protein OmpA-like peptidoglycan-associated protein